MLKRDINFFAVIGQDSSGFAIDFEKCVKISLAVFGVIAAVIIGLLLMVNGGQKLKTVSLEKSIEDLQEPLKEIEVIKAEAEQLQMDIDVFNQSINEFNQQARLTTKDIEKIAQCLPDNTVTITSFNYSEDTAVISCTGTTELAIADFANSLRTKEIDKADAADNPELLGQPYFASVKYTGVSKGDENEYSASVEVTLRSREEPEPEVPQDEGEGEGEETTEEGAEK